MTQSKQSFIDYDGFVEKFKPKKTTDDCYTPPEVMEVVNAYVDENGASVRTGFVTSLPSPNVAESEPDLGDAINAVCDELRHRTVNKLPKYEYPPEVVTAARMQWYAAHHTRYAVPRGECCKIPALDSQRAMGKTIFGGGLLLSERAAAERAAAERAAAERAAAKVWTLSERERAMQAMLGGE